MSGYHGRRAPNVSQYLANLNSVPSAYDVATQQAAEDQNLDSLTNTEFFDFDALNVDFSSATTADGQQDASGNAIDPQYQFMPYPSSLDGSPTVSQNFGAPFANFNAIAAQSQQLAPQAGDKRKAGGSSSVSSPADLEEQSRVAAEEDKRRRNTAASARFRVKKKQREQALEKQSKEMADKVSMLEDKVQQLEMENRWLKDLVTDKHDGKTIDGLKRSRDGEERSTNDRKDGVGTTKEGEEKEDEEEEEEEEEEDEKEKEN